MKIGIAVLLANVANLMLVEDKSLIKVDVS